MSKPLSEQITDIHARLAKPVVLVGMMGAGKSYLGAALASALDLPFCDSDRLIEEKAGCPVAEIFESYGESKFREAERNTIRELIGQGPAVIATGGGALTSPETLELLECQSVMIWLDADLETLWARVQKSQSRPLLMTENPKEKLASLLEQRRDLYVRAHIHQKTGAQNHQNDLDAMIKALYETLNTATV